MQPANSLSNAGFVVAGLAIAWYAGRRDRLGDVLVTRPGLPTAYAAVTVLLGPASAAMHATQSELGGHLDLLSMYLIASFAAAYALMRLVGQGSVFFFQVFLMLVAACELVGTVDGSRAGGARERQPGVRDPAGHRDRDRGGALAPARRARAPTCGGAAARSPRCWSRS